jgi:hypothetical protein
VSLTKPNKTLQNMVAKHAASELVRSSTEETFLVPLVSQSWLKKW